MSSPSVDGPSALPVWGLTLQMLIVESQWREAVSWMLVPSHTVSTVRAPHVAMHLRGLDRVAPADQDQAGIWSDTVTRCPGSLPAVSVHLRPVVATARRGPL